MDVNILLPTGHQICTCLQHIGKSGIVLRLARSIRGIHHDNGFLHVGRKDIPIIHLIFETCIRTLQLLYHRSKDIEWISLNIIRKNATGREHQHLFILLQLMSHIVRLSHHTIHPRIIIICQEIRDVFIYEVRHLGHLFHINLRHHIGEDMSGVSLL